MALFEFAVSVVNWATTVTNNNFLNLCFNKLTSQNSKSLGSVYILIDYVLGVQIFIAEMIIKSNIMKSYHKKCWVNGRDLIKNVHI